MWKSDSSQTSVMYYFPLFFAGSSFNSLLWLKIPRKMLLTTFPLLISSVQTTSTQVIFLQSSQNRGGAQRVWDDENGHWLLMHNERYKTDTDLGRRGICRRTSPSAVHGANPHSRTALLLPSRNSQKGAQGLMCIHAWRHKTPVQIVRWWPQYVVVFGLTLAVQSLETYLKASENYPDCPPFGQLSRKHLLLISQF